MNNRPVPHVGRPDREHIILPPVSSKAKRAAFSVERRAGSGFLNVLK